MKTAIPNGSPRNGSTAAMVRALAEGAEAAGHWVEILQVGKMKYCRVLPCGSQKIADPARRIRFRFGGRNKR